LIIWFWIRCLNFWKMFNLTAYHSRRSARSVATVHRCCWQCAWFASWVNGSIRQTFTST
jgi:hypothetical protein